MTTICSPCGGVADLHLRVGRIGGYWLGDRTKSELRQEPGPDAHLHGAEQLCDRPRFAGVDPKQLQHRRSQHRQSAEDGEKSPPLCARVHPVLRSCDAAICSCAVVMASSLLTTSM